MALSRCWPKRYPYAWMQTECLRQFYWASLKQQKRSVTMSHKQIRNPLTYFLRFMLTSLLVQKQQRHLLLEIFFSALYCLSSKHLLMGKQFLRKQKILYWLLVSLILRQQAFSDLHDLLNWMGLLKTTQRLQLTPVPQNHSNHNGSQD